jgi:hypothetical protein
MGRPDRPQCLLREITESAGLSRSWASGSNSARMRRRLAVFSLHNCESHCADLAPVTGALRASLILAARIVPAPRPRARARRVRLHLYGTPRDLRDFRSGFASEKFGPFRPDMTSSASRRNFGLSITTRSPIVSPPNRGKRGGASPSAPRRWRPGHGRCLRPCLAWNSPLPYRGAGHLAGP